MRRQHAALAKGEGSPSIPGRRGSDPRAVERVGAALDGTTNHGHRDTAARARTRTRQLIEILKTWGVLPASAALGASVASDSKSGTHFPEVTWRRASGSTERHWLRIRRPLNGREGPPMTVRFVTGICLFGKDGASAHLVDGSQRSIVSTRLSLPSPIERLSIHEHLSGYEFDTASRLSSVIGSMAERLIKPARVYVHVPVPEYVLFMLGHQRGVARGPVMKEWLEAVERRGALVAELFGSMLAREPASLLVHIGSPLTDVVMPHLHDAIASEEALSAQELVRLIAGSETPIGEAFKWWLDTRDGRDVGYYDLAHFGYVAGVVMNVLGRGLVIEVENPSEEPIFRAASRVIKRGRTLGALEWRADLMAVYPSERAARPSSDSPGHPDEADGRQPQPVLLPHEEHV